MSTGQMLCTADCRLVCQLFQFDLGVSIVIPAALIKLVGNKAGITEVVPMSGHSGTTSVIGGL